MADIYRVQVTDYAKKQLLEIIDYIGFELQAPIAAKNISKRLRVSIKSLAFMPGRIALIYTEPWRSRGIRKMIDGNYLIYFWIDEGNKRVIVTAIVGSKMNQASQLSFMDMR